MKETKYIPGDLVIFKNPFEFKHRPIWSNV